MSYRKIHVDNVTCWRRFHLAWDDTAECQDKTSVQCLHCGVTVFEANKHPPVRICREENLIQNVSLSVHRLEDCQFKKLND